MEFKLWSEINKDAKNNLKPSLGFRPWSKITKEEKNQMWRHLEEYFFDITKKHDNYGRFGAFANNDGVYYPFYDPGLNEKRRRIEYSIQRMFINYRVKNYTPTFLVHKSHFYACHDFYNIFINNDDNAVFELLSFYSIALLNERKNSFGKPSIDFQSDENFQKDKLKHELFDFIPFAKDVNSVFENYGVEVILTSSGFIPRQDNKIITEIFEPILLSLHNEKWNEVNKLLKAAFSEFRKNTPESFSTCITHVASSIQAYLQILVKGDTGNGEISKLILDAQNSNLIPSDPFSKQIFKNMESIIMQERQVKGDAHPKKEFANQKNAKLILNLSMVFFQHCLS